MYKWMRRAGVLGGVVAMLWVGGCAGGGGADGGSAAMLEGDAAVDAAIGVMQSTVSVLAGLRSESLSVSSGASSCSGGSVRARCDVENRQSVVRGSFDHCRLPLPGGDVATVNGGLTIRVGDQGTCVTGMVPDTASLELQYDNFMQSIVDSSGNELSNSRANGADRIDPQDLGCDGRNVAERISATIDAVSHGRRPGKLLADGVDAHLDLRDLQLDQESAGSPCARMVLASGEMDVDDRANGRRFSQTLEGVSMSFVEADDAALVQINGRLVNGCIGDVTLVTVEPIRMNNAVDCPTGGTLRVISAGRASEIRFLPGGDVSIDYDGDGQVDLAGASCRDTMLSECTP